MISRPRVAVVAAAGAALTEAIGLLAPPVNARRFRDLVRDAGAILALHPGVLLVEHESFDDELLGALHMVRSLLPDAQLILVGPVAHEVPMTTAARRLDAQVVTAPIELGQLAAAVHGATTGPSPGTARMLLDLTRGLSDEINNPLQLIGGYVRLLEDSLDSSLDSGLDSGQDRDRLDQIKLIQDGLVRIDATMAKIGLLARARESSVTDESVDLRAVTREMARAVDPGIRIQSDETAEPIAVRGSGDLLRAMLEQLLRAGLALRRAGGAPDLEVHGGAGNACIRLLLDASHLPEWRLPRSFEPYYLSRIFPGAPHGLSLSIVQILARNHGGNATASWARDGRLCLEVTLA